MPGNTGPELPINLDERTPHAEHTLRQWAYAILEEGQLEGVVSRIIEALLITLIIANVAAVALESVTSIYAKYHIFFKEFERFSVGAYTVEYLIRIWSSVEDPRIAARGPLKGRLAFAMRPLMIIDLMAFAPSYLGFLFAVDLRVLRIFRLFRLVKLARYSPALPALLGVLYAERSSLFASMILTLSVMCVSGELMHLAEGAVQPRTFGSMPDAMYWAITTLTTVGYGDEVPITPLGKFIAGVTMVTGLLLFALPIGIIANGFVSDLHRRQFAITWSMLKRQPLFDGFEVESVTEILDSMSAKLVREHAQLALTGQLATMFYLIVSGHARSEHEGEEVDLGPGDIVGEEAMHATSHYVRTVTARTEMRLIVLPGEELRRLARKFPLLGRRIRQEEPW
ncbi:MAG TPA: cyclic nucleotide-gated ion channel [Rhizomicrobium sp.]|nr:cyclic nucleotide-gated ion channel [Rhizomicrobium sp.]